MTVTDEVGRHHREVGGEPAHHRHPAERTPRDAVQQEEDRSGAPAANADQVPVDRHVVEREPGVPVFPGDLAFPGVPFLHCFVHRVGVRPCAHGAPTDPSAGACTAVDRVTVLRAEEVFAADFLVAGALRVEAARLAGERVFVAFVPDVFLEAVRCRPPTRCRVGACFLACLVARRPASAARSTCSLTAFIMSLTIRRWPWMTFSAKSNTLSTTRSRSADAGGTTRLVSRSIPTASLWLARSSSFSDRSMI